jgi:hypothetical protein
MNYAEHICDKRDEMGDPLRPDVAQCGICHRSWCDRCDRCDRCDPAPSALCPYCHGWGTSKAPIPPRQARRLFR